MIFRIIIAMLLPHLSLYEERNIRKIIDKTSLK